MFAEQYDASENPKLKEKLDALKQMCRDAKLSGISLEDAPDVGIYHLKSDPRSPAYYLLQKFRNVLEVSPIQIDFTKAQGMSSFFPAYEGTATTQRALGLYAEAMQAAIDDDASQHIIRDVLTQSGADISPEAFKAKIVAKRGEIMSRETKRRLRKPLSCFTAHIRRSRWFAMR